MNVIQNPSTYLGEEVDYFFFYFSAGGYCFQRSGKLFLALSVEGHPVTFPFYHLKLLPAVFEEK